jgi:hypothetical protein
LVCGAWVTARFTSSFLLLLLQNQILARLSASAMARQTMAYESKKKIKASRKQRTSDQKKRPVIVKKKSNSAS